MYVHDYGAPVGWRLALANPDAITAIITEHRVPVLAVWGRNDEIFGPAGALAFADDAPGAEICLLDGGHFLLESHLAAAAGIIRGFLERTLP